MLEASISTTKNEMADKTLGFSELKKWLRHKHPMIFLDRVVDYRVQEYLKALLVISGNMDCIDAHFPGRSLFPATHLQQSFCQAAIILLQLSTMRLMDDEIAMVGSMNSRFYKAAVPGDTIHIDVKVERLYTNSLIFSGEAFVDGSRIATINSTIVRSKINNMSQQLW
ncbi:MAG: beta-hydroxyacyl-ACP dehydratase [Gammaproteobacteria bacterium]